MSVQTWAFSIKPEENDLYSDSYSETEIENSQTPLDYEHHYEEEHFWLLASENLLLTFHLIKT